MIDTALLVQISNYGSRYIWMFWQIQPICINLCILANDSTVKVFNTTRQAPKFAARNFPENHTLSGSFWWIMLQKNIEKHSSFPWLLLRFIFGRTQHTWPRSPMFSQAGLWLRGFKAQASACWHAPIKSEQKHKKKERLHFDSVNLLRACFLHWGSDTLRWILTQQRDQVLLVLCSCVCVRSIIIGLFANRAAFRVMTGHFHIKKNSQNASDAARNNETTPFAAC